jgi:hypothetical protein
MHTAMKFLVAALVCMTMNAAATPPSGAPALNDAQIASLRANITDNLQDASIDIRTSTMQLVMELKDAYPTADLDFAIIPLMTVLKNDNTPELRILAACALHAYDSELARFAVSRRALYDSSDRVARHCAAIARAWMEKPVETVPAAIAAN